MLILDLLKMAIRSLISHKLRTFLTALGIIIGVASVISMISIGEGARQQTLSTISKFGTNIITINYVIRIGWNHKKKSRVSFNMSQKIMT